MVARDKDDGRKGRSMFLKVKINQRKKDTSYLREVRMTLQG